jgi:hypothetical protein
VHARRTSQSAIARGTLIGQPQDLNRSMSHLAVFLDLLARRGHLEAGGRSWEESCL